MSKLKEVLLYIVGWLIMSIEFFVFWIYGDGLPQPFFTIGYCLSLICGLGSIAGLTCVIVYPIYWIIEFLYEWIRDSYTNYKLMSASEFLELRSYEHFSSSELLGMKNKYPYNKKIATVVDETLHLRRAKMLYGSFMKDTKRKETKAIPLYKSTTRPHVYYTWFNKYLEEKLEEIQADRKNNSSVKDITKSSIEHNKQSNDKQ
jgi:hypothetical protein